MRHCRRTMQRCLSGTIHASSVLLAPASNPRRGGRGGNNASAATAMIEIDGEEFRPTAYGYGVKPRATSRTRRTPAQLLADLSAREGTAESSAAAAAAEARTAGVNPVELLLKKRDVRGGGGGGEGGDVGGGSSTSSGGGDKGSGGSGRGRARKAPLTPPTKSETAAAARTRGGSRSNAAATTEAELSEEVDADAAAAAAAGTASSSSLNASEGGTEDYQKALHVLTNPFRGLHAAVTRSYRIDQLLEAAKPEDVLLARQERKSTAFSFMRFAAGSEFYQGHWGSLAGVQQQLDSTLSTAAPLGSTSKSSAAPYVRGTPIPGLTLFNNDLGLQNPKVQCSYPLILAQRMLLFPDHLRQFHAICGREDVPCDFFADIDLPGESAAGAEKALLEVLDYLEVRLPGVGFTDPFFLVLANAVPNQDKMSFHVHARSMTYTQERRVRAELGVGLEGSGGGSKRTSSKKKKTRKNASTATSAEAEAEREDEDDDVYDDLSDMVNVVDGGGVGGKSTPSGATKLIAFQDYRAVKLIGDEVNQTLGRDLIDLNCYRPNGMLRCAYSSKLPSAQDHDFHAQQQHERHGAAAAATRRRLVPLVTASDSALQKRLSDMEAVLRTMTDPEILEMTFCTRHMDHDTKVQKLVHEHAKKLVILDSHAAAGSEAHQRSTELMQATLRHRWKLIRPRHILGPQASQAVEYDAYGNAVSPFLTEGAKWRRYKAVTAKLRKLPPRAAESYDVWVRVGLALHNFSNEDNCFEEWVIFSLKSPQKYSRDVCRRKWVQFERNPDALNWRRGYNYLNSTVWRQV